MTSATEDVSDLSKFAGSWTLDPARTSVTFHTKAMWVLNVTGTINAVNGTATLGGDGSLAATVELAAASVNTKNAKRDAHLRTSDFFDVETYPTMTFAATTARPTGPGKADINGEFTVVGQSRAVTVPASYVVANNIVTITAKLDIDRSQWGLSWSKMGAGLANHVDISAVFTKSS